MTATLVSGGTGLVGRFIVEGLLEAGHDVTVLARTPPSSGFFSRPARFISSALDPGRDQQAVFAGIDHFVHAAFDHVTGKYRGGEGSDPASFARRNYDGSMALLKDAKAAGVRRAVFLSSRAVYGPLPPGALAKEDDELQPSSLYGEIKCATERALAAMRAPGFLPVSLRVTGVYGPAAPGRRHKWSDLFDDFAAGRPIDPRVGTEVHGADLADAVRLVLEATAETLVASAQPPNPAGIVFNVSDILLDRCDLLQAYAAQTGLKQPLPEKADASAFTAMDCSRLHALGWTPGGVLDLSGMY